MKIISLKVENYKSIQSQTLDKLSNITMIFGHNNSGKSNLLKFIDIIFSRKVSTDSGMRVDTSRRTEYDDFLGIQQREYTSNFWEGIIEDQPFLFHKNNNTIPIKFEVCLAVSPSTFKDISYYDELSNDYFPATPKSIKISIFGEINSLGGNSAQMSLVQVQIEDRIVYSIDNNYFESADAKSVSLKPQGFQILNDILNYFNDSVLFLDNDRYFSDERNEISQEELSPKTFKNWFHNISLNPTRYREYLNIIKQVSKFKPTGDSEFTNNEKNSPIQSDLVFEFGVISNLIDIYLKNGSSSRLPLNHYGTGIQQVLYILAKIAEKRPKIILIEEIELNLSPKYQHELIQHVITNLITDDTTIREFFQLIFTTHSPLLCCRTDFIVYKITLNEKGETNAIRVGATERKKIEEFYPIDVIKNIVQSNANF